MKKFFSACLTLLLIFSFITPAFASYSMTFEEAKEYLVNYSATKENSLGEEYTVRYEFYSEEDINQAAEYIAEEGLDSFNEEIDAAIAAAVTEEKSFVPVTRTTDPSVVYRTVSGNGTHHVEGLISGMAYFDTLGTLEYQLVLEYDVLVLGGKLYEINNTECTLDNISAPSGGIQDVVHTTYCNDTNCGLTVRYVIFKTIGISWNEIPIGLRTEYDNEICGLLTSIA